MTGRTTKKLIEVALPLEAINLGSAREFEHGDGVFAYDVREVLQELRKRTSSSNHEAMQWIEKEVRDLHRGRSDGLPRSSAVGSEPTGIGRRSKSRRPHFGSRTPPLLGKAEGIDAGIAERMRVQSMSPGTPAEMVSEPRSIRVFQELP